MIKVKEIFTKKDKKKFFKFHIDLYGKNPHACPNLFADEFAEFDPATNDAFRFADCRMFLAYKNGKIAGRVAGIYHRGANEKSGLKQLRFTRFDVIDDFEVTVALFEKLKTWAKELGMDEIIGPMSFSDLNEEGMLIEGFDRDSTYIEIYNAAYYVEHMQKLSAYKIVDWNCYRIKVPEESDERLSRLKELVVKRNGYETVDVRALLKNDKARLREYIMQALGVLDEAFAPLYGTSPLNEKQKARETDTIFQILVPELASLVLKNGRVIAYGFMMPSIKKALQRGKGHIIPWGLIPFIKAMNKIEVAEMMSIGIMPEEANKGVAAVIMNDCLEGLLKLGVKYLETGPELEENKKVQNLWKGYERELIKKHRCWGIKVN